MQLFPCYEGQAHDGDHSPFHILNGEMDSQALWSFLQELCNYGGYSDGTGNPDTPEIAIKTLLSRETEVVAGGIAVIAGDFRLYPSCCCGLEDWVEWRNIKKNGASPWLGHDPDPWIDTSGDRAILHNGMNTGKESIDVSYEELLVAVENASVALSQFLEKLRSWLKEIDPEHSEQLSMKVSEWFSIKPISDWPEYLSD